MSEADARRPLEPARFMTRHEAASYVGVSTRTFDTEVANGIWPKPFRRGGKGGALTWDRRLLDAAADRIGGLGVPEQAAANAAADAATEQDILEAVKRGTTARPRHQAGQKAPR